MAARLVDIMTEAPVEMGLIKSIYREPSITAYNRLEPRPRTEDFSRSLRAEVSDALWFLTRQWQLGELEAEDAGSPIDARLATRRLVLDRVVLGNGTAHPYDDTIPLEVAVEREPVAWTLALKAEVHDARNLDTSVAVLDDD